MVTGYVVTQDGTRDLTEAERAHWAAAVDRARS